MKQKTIKKSIIACMTTLALSLAMFVGTTFAFFNDNITIKDNHITAGSLGIELVYRDNVAGGTLTTDVGGYALTFGAEQVADKNSIISDDNMVSYNAKLMTAKNVGTLDASLQVVVNNIKATLDGVEDASALDMFWFDFVMANVSDNSITLLGSFAAKPMSQLEAVCKQVKFSLASQEEVSFIFIYGVNGNEFQGQSVYFDVALDATAKHLAEQDAEAAKDGNTLRVNGVYYKDAAQAIEAASKVGGSVVVFEDTAVSSQVEVSANTTIVGSNGAALVLDGMDGVANNNNSVIKVSGENTVLKLQNISIQNNNSASGTNYQIAINVSGSANATVQLDNCNVKTGHYGINVDDTNTDVSIVANDCVFDAWAGLNIWSKTDITLTNCQIVCVNPHSGGSNNFANVVFNKPQGGTGSAGSTVKISGCTIDADTTGGNKQAFLSIRDENITIDLVGDANKFIFKGEQKVLTDLLINTGEAYIDYTDFYSEGINPADTITVKKDGTVIFQNGRPVM